MAIENGFKDISKTFNRMAKEAVEEAQDVAILAFANKVTQPAPSQGASGYTPVLEGVLIANTRLTYGRRNNSFSWNLKDPSGRETFRKLTRESNASVWLPIYITNNTPYNVEAEYRGWKFTAPYKYFQTAVYSSIEALNRHTR